MDGATELDTAHARPQTLRLRASGEQAPVSGRVAELLGDWRPEMLRIATVFPECRGLSDVELEEIYQAATFELLYFHYRSERHLRNMLRKKLKERALNLRRDEARRAEIFAEHAPGIHALEAARAAEETPEGSLLLCEDRLIVEEFLSELNALEREVFYLMADGMGLHRIAKALEITANEALNATRACERKRGRFQTLYESGRLCGFRAGTIQALQAGEQTSNELAARAFAHLDACPYCRAEHKTNATRLRLAFHRQAAALLPAPVLAAHLGWITRAGLRGRELQQRLLEASSVPAGGVREGAVGVLVSGGVGVKLAGIAATVVVAGTIGATHALDPPQAHHHHRRATSAPALRSAAVVGLVQSRFASIPQTHATPRSHIRHPVARRSGPGHVISAGQHQWAGRVLQHEPGGFAYLGIPATTSPARESGSTNTAPSGGGPFGP